MANTITYDPSNDPVVLAADEARDSENLAQGEKMAEEQSELLAGKYKNAEELEAAYRELESKLGRQEETTTEETTEQPEYGQPYQEDGAVNYDTVEQIYGEQITAQLEDAGVDPWKIAQHFEANEGNITQEMNDSLVNAGIPQDTIDVYLEGSRAQRGFGTQGELTEADVSEIHNLAGGKAAYDNLTQWAGNNLPADDVKAFDDVVATGNKSALRFAVKALNAQMEDAIGRNPDLVTGKTPSQGSKYRSMAEVVRDMGDARYDSDPAYRADIQQKLERSNLQV
jgi:hypothetical protein